MIIWIVAVLGVVLGFAAISTLTRASLTTITNQLAAQKEQLLLAVLQAAIGMLVVRLFLGVLAVSLGLTIHELLPWIERYKHYTLPALGAVLIGYGLFKSGLFAWWLREVEVKLVETRTLHNMLIAGLIASTLPNISIVYAMIFSILVFPEYALLLFLVSVIGSYGALMILAFKARSSAEAGMSFVDIELIVRLTGVMLMIAGFLLVASVNLL